MTTFRIWIIIKHDQKEFGLTVSFRISSDRILKGSYFKKITEKDLDVSV